MLYVYLYVLRKISFLECPGTIGHVAHGKSTVVKAISGVQVNIDNNVIGSVYALFVPFLHE
jgi:translation elongation factor EF-Tu-like GTPase